MAAEDRYMWMKEDLFGQLAGYGLLPPLWIHSHLWRQKELRTKEINFCIYVLALLKNKVSYVKSVNSRVDA